LKIGTGLNETEKGKVYIYKSNQNSNEDNNNNMWVYCNKKIYQKISYSNYINNSNNYFDEKKFNNNVNNVEFGYIREINPENFKVENEYKLIFPKNCYNNTIAK
jgi:hypothetical protein